MLNKLFILSAPRKDIGYLVGYSILSGLISRNDIGKSSLNIIPLKRYRNGILVEYFVRRYIYEIVSRSDIFIKYASGG